MVGNSGRIVKSAQSERAPITQILGTRSTMEKWVEGKLNKDFLYLLLNFCHIWWFFKVEHTPKSLRNLEKSSYMHNFWWKMEKNTLFNLPSTPFFGWLWVYQKIGFRVESNNLTIDPIRLLAHHMYTYISQMIIFLADLQPWSWLIWSWGNKWPFNKLFILSGQ